MLSDLAANQDSNLQFMSKACELDWEDLEIKPLAMESLELFLLALGASPLDLHIPNLLQNPS